ncbi:hypothetical protein CgunFtcFv8_000487 [Champsocephalus gunnari]|nr:hypothetical protein CgunFtcFv8_000487 [Champsocephalus gunnari]
MFCIYLRCSSSPVQCGPVAAPVAGVGTEAPAGLSLRRVGVSPPKLCRLEGCDPGTGRPPTTTHHSNRAEKKEKLDQEGATGAGGMNREEAPGKSPEDMYVQQKVRVLLMLKKMGSNLTPSEEAFLRNYAGVVHSQMSQLPQHNIDQGAEDVVMAFSRQEAEDRRQ